MNGQNRRLTALTLELGGHVAECLVQRGFGSGVCREAVVYRSFQCLWTILGSL